MLQEQNPGLALKYIKEAAELGSLEANNLVGKFEEMSGLYPCKMNKERLRFISQLVAKLDPGYAKYHLNCKSATFMNTLIGNIAPLTHEK